jgi:hypothetical protein
LVPNVTVIAFLVNAGQLESVAEYPEVEAASRQVGRKIVLVKAASEREFEPAFAAIVKACAGALVVGGWSCPGLVDGLALGSHAVSGSVSGVV